MTNCHCLWGISAIYRFQPKCRTICQFDIVSNSPKALNSQSPLRYASSELIYNSQSLAQTWYMNTEPHNLTCQVNQRQQHFPRKSHQGRRKSPIASALFAFSYFTFYCLWPTAYCLLSSAFPASLCEKNRSFKSCCIYYPKQP